MLRRPSPSDSSFKRLSGLHAILCLPIDSVMVSTGLVLSAAVVSCQARRELSSQAISMVRLEFENAVLSLCHNPCFDHTDLAPNQVAKLISNLLSSPPIDSPVLDAAQRQALIIAVQTKYGRDTATPILQSVIPNMRSVVPDLLPLTSLTRFLAFRLA